MLDQNSILDTENVRGDPVHRLAEARKSPVHNDEISFGYNRSELMLQRWGQTLDQIEQSVPARRDVSTVLGI